MREIQAPTVIDGVESHPAFGKVTVVRGSGSPRTLFQSDIQHSHTVSLTVETATRRRDTHQDWVHGREQIVEIEMSESQWAALVASVGNGSGTNVTLRSVPGDRSVPALPYQPRTEVSRQNVTGAVDRLLADVKEKFAHLEELEEAKAGVRERRAARAALRNALANATPNARYAVETLEEATENVVTQARADIEAMVADATARHGAPLISSPFGA